MLTLTLALVPAVLSLLVLAAHFLRRGQVAACAVCVAAAALVYIRRAWARRVLQGVLIAGVALWISTTMTGIAERKAMGEPWTKLVVILGSVAAFTLLSALLLQLPRAARWFEGADGH